MNRLNVPGRACAAPAYQQARVAGSGAPPNRGEAPLPPEITGAEALFKMPFKLLLKIIVIFLEAWGGKNGVSS